MKHIEEKARQTPVKKEVDVIVVGGGAAGIAAALAASRQGARVLLIEQNGFLGGTMTSVSLGGICGLYSVDGETLLPVVQGIASEMVERLEARGGTKGPKRWLKTASLPYDLFIMKRVCDEMVLDSGIDVVLHTELVDVIMEDDRITGVILNSQNGRWAALGQVIIDCSGDADVAAKAGASFEYDVQLLQMPSAMFRMADVDVETFQTIKREELHGFLEQAVADGMDLPRTAGGVYSVKPGMVHLNITRIGHEGRSPDPLDPFEMTAAEFAGRRQVELYQQAFSRYVPGFKNCFVLDSGAELGVRESRRVHGEYWLEVDDVLGERRFDDAIACSAWPVEDHGGGRATKWVWVPPGGYYQIPYRSLIPKNVRGLLMAGRCISASHDAQASVRVVAVSLAMGQAAGIAAAMAVPSGGDVREVKIQALQANLKKQGAFLGTHAGAS
jgi:hypothetical protein